MRPRYQVGSIYRRGPNWVLRYYDERNGKRQQVRVTLAPYSDYPYGETDTSIKRIRQELATKINAILAPVNGGKNAGTQNYTLGEFIEQSYFPRLDQRLQIPAGNELHIEPSTIKAYQDNWKVHVKHNPIAKIPLRNFSAADGQRFLEGLPQSLSHQTHLRVKNFLRGVFTWAITSDAIQGTNPMVTTKAGGRTKKSTTGLSIRQQKIQASNEHAYTLEEVAEMLDKLPEPARTVCAVAAFTGLSRSELKGLKWEDYDGKTISVRRKVWNSYVGAPKTEAREAGVYVVPMLQRILGKYRTAFPAGGDGWIFRGEKMMRPLDLDRLSRKVIPQYIKGGWFGWHAFRRGLGTRLNEAGVNDKDIQSILRHADVSTTQAYYILPNHERAQAGMKRLEKALRNKYGIRS